MRSEQEMMNLILKVAEEDERIRAVLLSGSRANPGAPRDKYQDYDITYYVKDVIPFYNNTQWVEEHFGKPLIMQMPENSSIIPPVGDGQFAYLIIFEDGNRIDLGFEFRPYKDDGEPAITLLNKDEYGFLPPLQEPSDKIWHIKPPAANLYADCCNEFWWCLNNVGKGIARDELPYVMRMYNEYVRDMLNQMLEWYIGVNTNFSVTAGKLCKYFKKYLPEEMYDMYKGTYSDGNYENVWNSIFTACDLFRRAALHVVGHCGYAYNQAEEDGMRKYLSMIKSENEFL